MWSSMKAYFALVGSNAIGSCRSILDSFKYLGSCRSIERHRELQKASFPLVILSYLQILKFQAKDGDELYLMGHVMSGCLETHLTRKSSWLGMIVRGKALDRTERILKPLLSSLDH